MAVKYDNDVISIGGTNVLKIIEEVSTPVYCYCLKTIKKNYQQFSDNIPDALICYAIKANSNIAVIKAIADIGGGADVVSEGEIRRALIAGISRDKIVFSGVGKTKEEITFALTEEIYQINIESLQELKLVNEIAIKLNKIASCAIRVNPNINAETHRNNTTGLYINKFGIPEEYVTEIFNKNYSNIKLVGISIHIGSQIEDMNIFVQVIQRAKSLAENINKNGIKVTRIDLGGGLAVPYQDTSVPDIIKYASILKENICNSGYKIICEPGRAIVANAGVLLTKVLYVKGNNVVNHVIVDVGINDFIRPALYNGNHKIIPVLRNNDLKKEVVDIVGPVCESSDIFASQCNIQRQIPGNYLAICDTGAYGASISSTYNSRRLIPEVLVNKGNFVVIRKRQTYEEMISNEVIPDYVFYSS